MLAGVHACSTTSVQRSGTAQLVRRAAGRRAAAAVVPRTFPGTSSRTPSHSSAASRCTLVLPRQPRLSCLLSRPSTLTSTWRLLPQGDSLEEVHRRYSSSISSPALSRKENSEADLHIVEPVLASSGQVSASAIGRSNSRGRISHIALGGACSVAIGGTRSMASSSGAPSTGSTQAVAKSGPSSFFMKLAKRSNRTCRRWGNNIVSMTMAAIRDPRVIKEWMVDIYHAIVHFVKWVVTGGRLFSRNVGACYHLTKRIAKGYHLSIRERRLLIRTTADCLKLIPFSFFIIVPFAELLLPVVLRFFPNLMPSTFFETKYDNATLARKLQAKQQMAEFFQQVVAQRTQEIIEDDDHKHADKAIELEEMQEKLSSGREFPKTKEILRFASLFSEEMKLSSMSNQQLNAMSNMLGLRPMTLPVHNQLQLRHHITSLRREDRDMLWEGIEGLTKQELIEACKKRAIRFHGTTEAKMRGELKRWLDISMHKKIPTSLMLWIQSFYLRSEEKEEGIEEPNRPDESEFFVKVEENEEDKDAVKEPKEALKGIAERRKADLENAQTRLEDLQQEIEQVIAEEEKVDSGKEVEEAQTTNATAMMEDEQEEKQCILKRIDELTKAQDLNRIIIERQREMLKHQLEFMQHMRDNSPERSQDANQIILDQRVRLVEMMKTFSKDLNEIEGLLNEADNTVEVSFAPGDKDWITNLFDQLDMNKDGVISRREFEKAARTLQSQRDADIMKVAEMSINADASMSDQTVSRQTAMPG